ncbi:MAG: hypothetical protein ACTSUE_10720 [Promethearchaeota archaeon]
MKPGKTFFSAFSIVYFSNWLLESIIKAGPPVMLPSFLSLIVTCYILSCVTIRIFAGEIKKNARTITIFHVVMMIALVSSMGIVAFLPAFEGSSMLLDRLVFVRVNIFFLPELLFYLVTLMNLQYSAFELIMVIKHVDRKRAGRRHVVTGAMEGTSSDPRR